MTIPCNCFRSNLPTLTLTREVRSLALWEAIAADLIARGIVSPSADPEIFINRVARPLSVELDGTGDHDGATDLRGQRRRTAADLPGVPYDVVDGSGAVRVSDVYGTCHYQGSAISAQERQRRKTPRLGWRHG